MKNALKIIRFWFIVLVVIALIDLSVYGLVMMKYHAYEHIIGHRISFWDYLFGPTYIAPASK